MRVVFAPLNHGSAKKKWRSDGDSNPGGLFRPYPVSSRVPSSTRASLPSLFPMSWRRDGDLNPGGASFNAPTRFRVAPLQPLGHPSIKNFSKQQPLCRTNQPFFAVATLKGQDGWLAQGQSLTPVTPYLKRNRCNTLSCLIVSQYGSAIVFSSMRTRNK